jgi:alpha-tubulin suppressor-like RCC1 family protein
MLAKLRAHRAGASVATAAALLALALAPLPAYASGATTGVYAWGQDSYGALGNGLEADAYLPDRLTGLEGVKGLAAGYQDSYELLEGGTVLASGDNDHGQLGDGLSSGPETCSGATPCARTPVEIPGLGGVQALSAGDTGVLALLEDGHVLAWGENQYGELGVGSAAGPEKCVPSRPVACSRTPLEVHGITEAVAVAAGGSFRMALLSDGHVMTWGLAASGQLGTGVTPSEKCVASACSTVPVEVAGLTGVKAIAAGSNFALALLEDGQVMVWGDSALGGTHNSPDNSNVPVEQTGLGTVTAISADFSSALALLSDGTVKQWRMEDEPSDRAPEAVAGLTGANAVSAGWGNAYAKLEDGELASWGGNEHGQLGYGYKSGRSATPSGVCRLSGVTLFAGGGFHALASVPLETTRPVLYSTSHRYGPKGGGETVLLEGRDLGEASEVRFGATSVPFTVLSESEVQATSPAATGELFPTVTTPAGTSYPCGGADYVSINPPYLNKSLTKSGPATGGVHVLIEGGLLAEVQNVYFGATPASSLRSIVTNRYLSLESYNRVEAVSPAETAGVVSITVTAAGGTSPASKKAIFKVAPVITEISPDSLPLAGGTVTIRGFGFQPGSTGTTLGFGSTKAKVYDCASGDECTVHVPARSSAGSVKVKMKVNKVNATNEPAFTFE